MKIGVVGLGSIGLRHARNLRSLGHEVFGWDPEKERAEFTQARTRDALFDWAEAVVIATPSNRHIDDLRTAVLTDKPALVEKPIATSLKNDLRSILADARQPIYVGFNLRFHGAVMQARRWIEDKRIGTPMWAHLAVAQANEKPAYRRDGVILNWASHEVDLALHLIGPGEVVASSADAGDSIADFVIVHDNGCRSSVHADYVTKPDMRQTIIVGNRATIVMDLVNRMAWLLSQGGPIIQQFNDDASLDSDYHAEMAAFIHAVQKNDAGHLATADDGIAALEVCLTAKQHAGLPTP